MNKRLTQQQKRRIKQQHHDKLSGQCIDHAAIVIAHLGYEVIVSHQDIVMAADWRQGLGDIAVNDRVLIEQHSEGRAIIEAIFPRKKALYKWHGRKMKVVASHIDQLLVVIAARPQWQAGLLDRYLIAAHNAEIDVCIVCNKIDLLNEQQRETWLNTLAPYRDMGYKILPFSAISREGLAAVEAQLVGQQSVICGQSGVGKSSLIHTLLPDCDIWIQSLSAVTDLGRHTTTNSRRYPLGLDGAVIDTPGVRGFAVNHLTRENIIAGFRDIAQYSNHCRFSDCRHEHEPDCAVLYALNNGDIPSSRYNSLIQLLEENNL